MSDQPGLQMKYFVLKPRGESAYAAASRVAMMAYSRAIMEENPKLSKELWSWATLEHTDAHEGLLKEMWERELRYAR